MKFNIEVCIKISNNDLSIKVSYIVNNLDFYGKSSGFWYRIDLSLNKVFSLFFLENTWTLLEEGMGHWVNDDFKEEFPYQLNRDITDYCFDILKNKSGTTAYFTQTDHPFHRELTTPCLAWLWGFNRGC